MCARCQNLGGPFRSDAAKREDRKWAVSAGIGKGLQALGGTVSGFGWSGVNGTESDEVGSLLEGCPDLLPVVRGNPDQHLRTDLSANKICRKGTPAEVDTVGFYSKGDINMVVDQQQGVVLPGQGAKLPCQRQELIVGKIFFTELDCFDATLQRRFNGGCERVSGRDLVTVGDQVEMEIDGVGHPSHQGTKTQSKWLPSSLRLYQ